MESKECLTETEAIAWIKGNKKYIKEHFASKDIFPPISNPISIFMAGAPGVGKTEFSKSFIKVLHNLSDDNRIVRIDTDEVRELIPGYNGTNAPIFQKAAALGIEYVIDTVHNNSQSVFVDTTLCNMKIAKSNIERALGRKRKTGIFYLYQNPKISWEFTKQREKIEGRVVPKDFFVNSLFSAKENVNELKEIFQEKLILSVVTLNEQHGIIKAKFNIDNVDGYVKIPYTKDELLKSLK